MVKDIARGPIVRYCSCRASSCLADFLDLLDSSGAGDNNVVDGSAGECGACIACGACRARVAREAGWPRGPRVARRARRASIACRACRLICEQGSMHMT